MGAINRTLLFFYTLFFAAVSIGVILIVAHVIPDRILLNEYQFLSNSWQTGVAAGAVFLLSIHLLLCCFDRKAEKGNMLSRVIMSCLVVIDIIVYLIYKGFVARNLTFAFWNILIKYPISLIYLALINTVTFFVYLKDKKAAEKGKDRVKIVTLLSLSFIGGSIGALCGMYILHHKTNKSYFTVGVPLMIVMQILVLFYLSNMAF